MDKEKEELLKKWLDKAGDDLRVAKYLSTMHHPTPDEIICFHCQQSAEKYLKAFIFYNDIEPEKTHDLEYLLELCQKYNKGFSILSTKADLLNRYGIMPRYPNELQITEQDMKNAISNAKVIEEFVLNIFEEQKKQQTENHECEIKQSP